MIDLVLLLVAVAVIVIAWRYRQQRQENKLRENFPHRRVIEVALPRSITDSNKRMQRFFSKAVTAAQGDAKARRTGMRQVDVVYLAEVMQGQAMAEVRYLIYVDEDKMDAVKRDLKQVFDGMAHVTELPPGRDPMEEIASQLRPPQSQPEVGTVNGGEERSREPQPPGDEPADGDAPELAGSPASGDVPEPAGELAGGDASEPAAASSLRARMHLVLDKLDGRVAARQRAAKSARAHPETAATEEAIGSHGAQPAGVRPSLRARMHLVLDKLDGRVAARQRAVKSARAHPEAVPAEEVMESSGVVLVADDKVEETSLAVAVAAGAAAGPLVPRRRASRRPPPSADRSVGADLGIEIGELSDEPPAVFSDSGKKVSLAERMRRASEALDERVAERDARRTALTGADKHEKR